MVTTKEHDWRPYPASPIAPQSTISALVDTPHGDVESGPLQGETMFTKESLDQLEAAGAGLVKVATGLSNGVGADDIAAALTEVALAQAVVDEIKADKGKAISYMLGSALRAFGAS